MLSDEEKKAIETIKDLKEIKWYEHAFDNGTEILSKEEKQDIDVILNLIEKQSKEIEELKFRKEESIHITKETVDFINSHYIHKDEIKAKIEELKKYSKEHGYINMRSEINVLQSLLNEEE